MNPWKVSALVAVASSVFALVVHAAPSLAARASVSSPPGALDRKTVASVVASHREEVRKACWRPQHAKSPARIQLELTIAPEGKVASSQATQSEGHPAVGVCVRNQASGWSFPATQNGGRFVVPFLFTNE